MITTSCQIITNLNASPNYSAMFITEKDTNEVTELLARLNKTNIDNGNNNGKVASMPTRPNETHPRPIAESRAVAVPAVIAPSRSYLLHSHPFLFAIYMPNSNPIKKPMKTLRSNGR
ncbi:hypothetical protein DdX_13476 [Ditylenchus destructor]|uniref:Uncharacterized protein n=1 Tax=Ditylenchus destructor TaxID=166010 RepID=A0AAD4MYU2_9BILA|nr:hypothetical protein DdX_13476 [Ditylenchus destructor]